MSVATGKPLTGRKVLAIAIGAFGTIIAANLAMAWSAIHSFPGVEVKNGYIASQSFEADRAAQNRLGWRSEAVYADGVLSLTVNDAEGRPAPIRETVFRMGRPTTEAADLTPDMLATANGWRAELDLAPGLWRLDVAGASADGVRFRQHLVFEVRG